MWWLIVGGAASMAVGSVLLFTERRRRRRLGEALPPVDSWADDAAAPLDTVRAALQRILVLDEAMDRLACAVGAILPPGAPDGVPHRADVLRRCAEVVGGLDALARHELAGAPPSGAAVRFAELTAAAVPPHHDPYAGRLGEILHELRTLRLLRMDPAVVGAEPVERVVERYAAQQRLRDGAARQGFVHGMLAAGAALRAEVGGLRVPTGPELAGIAQELLGAASAYVDAGHPADGDPVVAPGERAAFAQRWRAAAAVVASSERLLGRGDAGEALRVLTTLSVPSAVGWARSDAYVDACHAGARALTALGDRSLSARVRFVEGCAAAVERQVNLLARQGIDAARDRWRQHDAALRSVSAAADRTTVETARALLALPRRSPLPRSPARWVPSPRPRPAEADVRAALGALPARLATYSSQVRAVVEAGAAVRPGAVDPDRVVGCRTELARAVALVRDAAALGAADDVPGALRALDDLAVPFIAGWGPSRELAAGCVTLVASRVPAQPKVTT